jgi:hypothetical protein
VELAAYNRLVNSKAWLVHRNEQPTSAIIEDCIAKTSDLIKEVLQMDNDGVLRHCGSMFAFASLLQLALVLRGDAKQIDEIFASSLSKLQRLSMDGKLQDDETHQYILLSCAMAKKQLEIRQIETYRKVVRSPLTTTITSTGSQAVQSYSSRLVELLMSLQRGALPLPLEFAMNLTSTAVLCCQELADGENALKLIDWFLQEQPNGFRDSSSLFDTLTSIEKAGQSITVRVINLERRPDRMASFMAQAMQERLVIVRGVSILDISEKEDNTMDGYSCGCYAIDGKGRPAEIELRLIQLVGGQSHRLNELVETHWRPNDLKPFDTDAPESEDLVRISPSEKACALSHVATWKGVVRSLTTSESVSDRRKLLFVSCVVCQYSFVRSAVAHFFL